MESQEPSIKSFSYTSNISARWAICPANAGLNKQNTADFLRKRADEKVVLGQTKVVLGQTKVVLGQTKVVLGQTKVVLGQTKVVLGQTKIVLGQTKIGSGQMKIVSATKSFGQTKVV
ncbi:MAG: hypothetical protein IPL28_04775 [Chloroflexi bacterium]|nr:hypothetical protein [Chloroflexota bacterium]